MKTRIEVSDMKEAKLLKAALADPETRALVKVFGALRPLRNDVERRAVVRAALSVVQAVDVITER